MKTGSHEQQGLLEVGLDFLLRMKDGVRGRGSDAPDATPVPRAFEERSSVSPLETAARAIHALSGKRLGLLCNPASVTLDFVPAPRALLAADFDVRVLFGPEHGFWGAAQDMEAVAGGEASRLPVISLYGGTF